MAPPHPELRVYLLVKDLQRQFAAYLGTPTRARGYPPFAGEHSLIVGSIDEPADGTGGAAGTSRKKGKAHGG